MVKKTSFQYNKKYWKLISRDYKKTAKRISRVRWNFVRELKPKVVLDYGAGANFLVKFAPKGVLVDTFDIGDFPIKYTGIRHECYDLVFLCDVLEHIPDFRTLNRIFEKTKYVYISLPILPEGKRLRSWKHFKFDTGEHLHYFTKRSLDLFFEARRFKLIKSGYPEVECGVRTDIYSAVYKREIRVFTNGVFDLLTPGHVYLLKKAKSLGDVLMVAINSDKSATRIKRKPINSQEERKEILKSLKYVDEVEIFNEDDPLRLIKRIKPDILVKGGDYTRQTVVGHEFVESYGGEVVIIPRLKKYSTTLLLGKIKGRTFKINKDSPKKEGEKL